MDNAKTNLPEGRFLVRVADNFQYMDSSEWFELGRYATLDEAIDASCGLVTRWLERTYTPGMTAKDLYDSYVSFGDDPFITDTGPDPDPVEGDTDTEDFVTPGVLFSAWKFAEEMAPIVVAMKSAANQ